MKKIILFLCALIMALMLPATAMAAYSWDIATPGSGALYALEITKYAAGRDDTGGASFFTGDAAEAKNQQFVYFSIKLTLPKYDDLIARYGYDPATDDAKIVVEPAGISAMSIITSSGYAMQTITNTNLTAKIPGAKTASSTVYFGPDGRWHDTAREAMWAGSVTDATKAAVTVSINYDAGIKNIPVEYGTKTYYINAWSGGGYYVSDGNARLRFVTNTNGRVTGALLMVGGTEYKVYATMTGLGVEGDAYGYHAAIAADMLNALGISYSAINAGTVYMTNKNILANFKPGVCVSTTATWYAQAAITTTTIPTTTVIDVPQTGDQTGGVCAVLAFVAAAAQYCVAVRERRVLRK